MPCQLENGFLDFLQYESSKQIFQCTGEIFLNFLFINFSFPFLLLLYLYDKESRCYEYDIGTNW